MKKYILILLVLISCIYACYANTTFSVNGHKVTTPDMQYPSIKYYCPQNGISDGSYTIDDLYEPSADCEHWNRDFWKEHSPNAYNECKRNREICKQRLANGYCDKITVEHYNYNNTDCSFEVSKKHKKVIGTSCNGNSMDEVIKIFKSKYGYK